LNWLVQNTQVSLSGTGNWSYSVDAANRLTSVTDPNSETTSFTLDLRRADDAPGQWQHDLYAEHVRFGQPDHGDPDEEFRRHAAFGPPSSVSINRIFGRGAGLGWATPGRAQIAGSKAAAIAIPLKPIQVLSLLDN